VSKTVLKALLWDWWYLPFLTSRRFVTCCRNGMSFFGMLSS